MFTGIIEELGKVNSLEPINGGLRCTIAARQILSDISEGDSICINGVCLTVIHYNNTQFTVEMVGETLEKTNLGDIKAGAPVNLERSLAANGRFGGHFVQGHVNATAVITRWYARGDNWYLEVELPESLMRYVIPEGSIAIDGISLTVAALNGNHVGINIIPHTVKVTNLQHKTVGDLMNIEVDMIAKYVENFIKFPKFKGEPNEQFPAQ